MIIPNVRKCRLASIGLGFVPLMAVAAPPAVDTNPAVESRAPLPGLISTPPPLAGQRRWQMFCKNPGFAAGGVDFSSDGRRLALATGRVVRIFETSGNPVFQTILVGHTDLVSASRFSPNGESIATASIDGTVRIWNIDGREKLVFTDHEDAVRDVAWHPDGKRLASASTDGTVRIWSIDGKGIACLTDHEAPVNAVAFCPDGKRLASGCENKTIRYWSPDGEKGPVAEGHIGPIRSLAWNFDGSKLLSCDHGIESADENNSDLAHMKIWDTNGQQLNSTNIDRPLTHVCWSPDGKRALGGGSHAIWIWNIASNISPTRTAVKGVGLNTPVAWHPKGDLITAGSQFHNTNGTALDTIAVRNIPLTSVSLSPNGSILAVARGNQTFSLYDGRGQQTFQSPRIENGQLIMSIFWNPDGKSFFAAQRYSPTLKRFDAVGKPIDTPIRLPSVTRSGQWSKDGKYFATGGDGLVVLLVDVEKGTSQQIGRQTHGITQVRFTADQTQVCSAGFDGCVRFFSLDGKPVNVFEAISTSIRGLALSSDGKLVVTGSEDGMIRFWSSNGELENVIGGHGGYIESLDFDPSDSLLASGSWDQTVRIWKRDGSSVSVLRGHEGAVQCVQWSRDGRKIVSCDDEGAVRMWDATTGETEWQSLYGEADGYVTLDSHGRLKYGDEKILESDFVFFAEDEQRRLVQTKWADIRAAIETATASLDQTR